MSVWALGCLQLQKESPVSSNECTACHGDPERSGDSTAKAAPPFDVNGKTSVTARGVGAHSIHLGGEGHRPLPCTECHQVPKTTFSQGHVDSRSPAEIVFGSLSNLNAHKALYDPDTLSCKDTYCHGDSPHRWTHPRSSEAACGTCHDLPPPAPHPQQSSCVLCHGGVIDATRRIIQPERHVDGHVDVKYPKDCSSCHGTEASPAPPPDLAGSLDARVAGVGAHQQHLHSSTEHATVACTECHVVPQAVDAPGHLDARQGAEVIFGALAKARGNVPSYDRSTGTCSGTYCHGTEKPVWTRGRDFSEACGSCHGVPPASPHPPDSRCEACHSQVVGKAQTVTHPELHINGNVEYDGAPSCSGCHGNGPLGAVPPDLSGNMSSSARGVGAHEQHLVASFTHDAVACDACHRVPTQVTEASHIDEDYRAEVQFAPFASWDGHRPEYDAAESRCSDTYCHGAITMHWQSPRNSADACGSCHGVPPSLPHPPRQDCGSCHSAVMNVAGEFIARNRHGDGDLDLNESGCSLCHGSAKNAAPPMDLSGRSERSQMSIGAHQAHLEGGNASRQVSCNECHLVPTSVAQAGHLDSFDGAEVAFTGPALGRNRVVIWDPNGATCRNNYCHDPSETGQTAPTWNSTTGPLHCDGCHAMPPPPPHVTFTQCSFCHGDAGPDQTIIDRLRHVNGRVDF